MGATTDTAATLGYLARALKGNAEPWLTRFLIPPGRRGVS